MSPSTVMTDEAYSPTAAAAEVENGHPADQMDEDPKDRKSRDVEDSGRERSKKSKRRSRSESRSRSRSRSRRSTSRSRGHRSRSRSRGHRSRRTSRSGSRSRSHRNRSRSGSRHRSRRHSRSASRSPGRDKYRRRSYRRSRSRSASPPRRPDFRHRRRAQSTPPPEDPERDRRTVFVMQLAARLTPADLKEFFNAAGKVSHARIIENKNSRKSKGMAYVEFEDIESVPKALGLTGQRLLGVPIIVQLSNAEKNRQAALAAAAAKNAPSLGVARLHVANIHPKLQESDIKQLFELEGQDVKVEMGTVPGTATISYKDLATARLMAEQLNEVEVAELKLAITLMPPVGGPGGFQPRPYMHQPFAPNNLQPFPYPHAYGHPQAQMFRPPQMAGQSLFLDEMGDGGLNLSRQSRHELMQKLARDGEGPSGLTAGSSHPQFPAGAVPTMGAQMPGRFPLEGAVAPMPVPVAASAPAKQPSQGPIGVPSVCFVIKNMFDAATETEPDWDKNLEEDVREECQAHGPVTHVRVVKESEGYVYVKFATVPASLLAAKTLDGRYFAKRQLSVEFLAEVVYNQMFPEAS